MNKVSNDKNPTRKEFKETKKSLKTLNKDFNTKFSLFKKRLNQRDDKDSSSELFGMLNEVTGLFEQIATEATKTISLKNKQLQSNAFLMDPFKDAYEGSVIDRALFHLSTIWYNSIEYLTVSDVLKHSVQFNKEVKKLEELSYESISHGEEVSIQRDNVRNILDAISLNFNILSKRLNYVTIEQKREDEDPKSDRQIISTISYHQSELSALQGIDDDLIEDYTDVKAYTDAVISLSRKSTLKDKDKFQELLNKAIVFHGNIKVQLERSTGFTHFKTFQELKTSLKEISKDSLPGQVAKQKAKDITQLALPGLSTDKSIELKPKSEEEIKENLERLRHQTSLPVVEVDQDTFSADDMNNSMDVKMRIKRLKERYNIFSKYRSIRSAITQNIKDLKSKTKKFIILLAKPVKKIKEDKKEEIDAYELDLALEEIKNSFELLNKAIDSYVEMYKQWFRGKGSEEEKKNFIRRERERMKLDNTMRAGLR